MDIFVDALFTEQFQMFRNLPDVPGNYLTISENPRVAGSTPAPGTMKEQEAMSYDLASFLFLYASKRKGLQIYSASLQIYGGGAGIRTLGTLRYNRFRVCHLRPLGHPSRKRRP